VLVSIGIVLCVTLRSEAQSVWPPAATVVTLNANGDGGSAGTIDPANESEFYAFTVVRGGRTIIQSTGGLDSHGVLYDGTGAVLARDDDAGTGDNFRIIRALGAGTYYVRVTSHLRASIGSYALLINAPIVASPDGNDTFRTASVVGLNGFGDAVRNGEIDPESDRDYYRFTVFHGGPMVVRTSGSVDTFGALYDSSRRFIASNNNAGSGANFQIAQTVSRGNYYVRVTSRGGSTGDYVLHINSSSAITPDGNDRFRLASVVGLNGFGDGVRDGSIEPADDVDFYRFTTLRAGTLVVDTTGGLNTHGVLYDSSRTELARDDDSGAGDNFEMTHSAPRGTYYVRVTSSGGGSTGDYRLRINGPGVVSVDGNDTFQTATVIGLDGYGDGNWAGTIDPAEDRDYYRFSVYQAGPTVVYTTGITDTRGVVYDRARAPLASDDDSGDGSNFRMVDWLGRGTYYVCVTSSGGAGTGDYVLHIDSTGATSPDGNDTIPLATYLPLDGFGDGAFGGEIDPATDYDFYRLVFLASGPVDLYTTGSLDSYGIFYDASGNIIARDNDSGTGTNFHVTSTVPHAGMYYVRVSSSGVSSTGTYTVAVDGPGL
jgi:hypothetical protein